MFCILLLVILQTFQIDIFDFDMHAAVNNIWQTLHFFQIFRLFIGFLCFSIPLTFISNAKFGTVFKNGSLITHHGKHYFANIFSEYFTPVNIRAFSKQGEVVGLILICFNERILESNTDYTGSLTSGGGSMRLPLKSYFDGLQNLLRNLLGAFINETYLL